jgi:tyrosyl-tRNA synthetase
VDANARTYLAQVFKLLDKEKTEVHRNSDWLDKLSSQEIVRLCGHYRLARMLEREDFRSRLENQQPISVHELLYPLLTAVDAVELKSDVELGATEQKFNLLVGREIQREYGQASQVALTMPILVGLDGQRKMSKSLDNYVGISEAPSDMFGKLMSLSDAMMWPYFDLVTDRSPEEIAALAAEVKAGGKHPMDVKMALAKEIIAGFHGEVAAQKAAAEFQRVFRDREAPDEVPAFGVASGTYKLLTLLSQAGLVSSRSEAERLIRGRAVEIDGQVVDAMNQTLILHGGESVLLRAGKKKFLRIVAE